MPLSYTEILLFAIVFGIKTCKEVPGRQKCEKTEEAQANMREAGGNARIQEFVRAKEESMAFSVSFRQDGFHIGMFAPFVRQNDRRVWRAEGGIRFFTGQAAKYLPFVPACAMIIHK